jgi:hypothetical protein
MKPIVENLVFYWVVLSGSHPMIILAIICSGEELLSNAKLALVILHGFEDFLFSLLT